jgi:hypothetical protein
MRFPLVRERVRVQGRDGTFVVLAVDRARGVANLVSAAKGGHMEENVPLSSILPLVDESSPHTKKETSSN